MLKLFLSNFTLCTARTICQNISPRKQEKFKFVFVIFSICSNLNKHQTAKYYSITSARPIGKDECLNDKSIQRKCDIFYNLLLISPFVHASQQKNTSVEAEAYLCLRQKGHATLQWTKYAAQRLSRPTDEVIFFYMIYIDQLQGVYFTVVMQGRANHSQKGRN